MEKDFWVTEVLRASTIDRDVALPDGSTQKVQFLFKGGTSLSRVFGIVERFSEDVDLLAVFPHDLTLNSRHKTLKSVDKAVTTHLGFDKSKVTVGPSTTGIKRYTTYHYPTIQNNGSLKEGVLLELGSRGGVFPSYSHSYRSMVAEYAINNLGEDETTWDEYASFEIAVLAPERTLLEKIAAVHDAATRNNTDALLKYGRHFYDIDRLLNTPEVVAALKNLGPDGTRELVLDIDANSKQAGFSWTPRPASGYSTSPAFDPKATCHDAIATGFTQSQALIYGTRITLTDVFHTVSNSRHLL